MKPTGAVARIWPDDAAGLRALVSVRWRHLIGTPARRPRVPWPTERNAAVRAHAARMLYGKRLAGHAGVDMPASSSPGAPPLPAVRVIPIEPADVPPEGG